MINDLTSAIGVIGIAILVVGFVLGVLIGWLVL